MVIGIDASRAFVVNRTGTEEYSYQLITHILRLPASKKHHFVLFIRPGAKINDELLGYSNVKIKIIPWKYLWTQGGLAWETWRTKLDVLWIPAHTLPFLRNSKIRTIVTIHGLEYKYLPEYKNYLQRWYLPLSTYYAAKKADKIIAVSMATKRDLLNEVKVDPDKIEVILEGVQPIERQQTETIASVQSQIYQQYGILPKKYILFVGTIQPRKNVGALISAFASFYKQHNDYKLVLAGGVGWMAKEVLALPTQLKVEEAVVWTGRVSSLVLQTLYHGAWAYVQPSWTEGFGLPVVEAMQNEVPVIVSSGGAMPEVVGEAGIVVPLTDDFSKILAETLTTLVLDKKRTAELKKRAKARVADLTWNKAARASFELITRG